MKKIPFHIRIIRGAIGKKYVVKHYSYGVIMTRYPDMTNIIASSKQKFRRRLFKKAVAFAKAVYADPSRKEAYRKILRKPKRLYQALMKIWFKKNEEKKYLNEQRLERWRRNIIIHHAALNISEDRVIKSNIPPLVSMLLLSG